MPCDLHTVNYDMSVAYSALQRLTLTQRGMVLTWFCPWCYRYLPPGQSRVDCEQARCLLGKEPPGGR
jgi:hypothetical protein